MSAVEETLNAAVTNDETTSVVIDLYGKRSGFIYVPNGETVVTITWWSKLGDNLYEALDVDDQTIAADGCYQIPTGLFGAPNIVPVSNTATATLHFVTIR